MITHLVLFKLKDPSPAVLESTRAVLMHMKGRVPSLKSIEVGIDRVRSSRSYDIALTTRFETWDDLELYRRDPVHGRALAHLQNVVEHSICVDYDEE